MKKKRVSVQIEGRSYVVTSADEPEYVQKVAETVTKSIREASSHSTTLDTRDCAVLAALNFCDDRNKAVKRNSDVVKKADQIIAHTNELNKQMSEYKERLAEAINENTRLTKRIRALDEQLRLLVQENEALKKQVDSKPTTDSQKKFEKTVQNKVAEQNMGYVPMRQYSLFDNDSLLQHKDDTQSGINERTTGNDKKKH